MFIPIKDVHIGFILVGDCAKGLTEKGGFEEEFEGNERWHRGVPITSGRKGENVESSEGVGN